ncbi:ParA family protein [Formosa algae]|uniref:Chromosome partitioning protein n=1 Tax=Formosa algae TaxID=225843 RepID=A0A9X1C835_9FLAO|nr:ParA family protein [Formosa algae]MBP1838636.1 chromosome partitioning protein [Formosa algae]MDQ0335136.1 chromosome partitioning protein [Formosa algae]OEI80387.1 conjugal transfer protein TraA [Formosa algae]
MTKIILITHQKGGVGKSTLAFNLAKNISNRAKVALIDMDLQGSLSQLKDIVSSFDILSSIDNIDKVVQFEYDFVFIDTPPYLSDQLPKLINMADLILIPTKAGVLDLLAIKSTIELIENENKKDHALIVFNMIKANTTLTLDIQIELSEYNVPIARTHISDLVSFTRSVLVGGVKKDKNAQQQLDGLTQDMLQRLV